MTYGYYLSAQWSMDYPKANFIEWLDDGSKFGVLIYSEPLTREETEKYNLKKVV